MYILKKYRYLYEAHIHGSVLQAAVHMGTELTNYSTWLRNEFYNDCGSDVASPGWYEDIPGQYLKELDGKLESVDCLDIDHIIQCAKACADSPEHSLKQALFRLHVPFGLSYEK